MIDFTAPSFLIRGNFEHTMSTISGRYQVTLV